MKSKVDTSRVIKLSSPLDETNYYDSSLLVKKTKGINVWAEGDSVPYIDLLMGYSSTNFGHANDDILKIVTNAIKRYDNITSFNSADKIDLTQKLIDLLPFPGDRLVYYPVGGAKAIDAAFKLARAFTKKDVVLSFNGAFHGYSFAAMSVTDESFVEKSQFSIDVGKASFDFPNKTNPTAKADAERILGEIENYLKAHNDRVAAILFEPIQGAAGFIVPPSSFLVELVKLAKKYGIISICDEIQTGICRTGSFYYINQAKIDPDIVLLGKSLAGGYYPLSAVIARRQLFQAVNIDRPGFDSTFSNNLLAMAIANHILDYINDSGILKKVQATGKIFLDKLKKIEKFDFIKDVSGIGMAFSYRVQAPSNKQEDNAKLAKLIRKEAFSNHLIIQTAGIKGDYMKLSPSFLITEQEAEDALGKLNAALKLV